MSSGFADERTAIATRLASNWSTTTIQYEGQPFVQPTTPWISLSILSGAGRQASLGSSQPLHRFVGVIQIDVFVPENTGTNTARQYADTLSTIFRRAQFSYGSSGVITCETPSVQPGPPEAGWNRLIVSTPYRRDVHLT